MGLGVVSSHYNPIRLTSKVKAVMAGYERVLDSGKPRSRNESRVGSNSVMESDKPSGLLLVISISLNIKGALNVIPLSLIMLMKALCVELDSHTSMKLPNAPDNKSCRSN